MSHHAVDNSDGDRIGRESAAVGSVIQADRVDSFLKVHRECGKDEVVVIVRDEIGCGPRSIDPIVVYIGVNVKHMTDLALQEVAVLEAECSCRSGGMDRDGNRVVARLDVGRDGTSDAAVSGSDGKSPRSDGEGAEGIGEDHVVISAFSGGSLVVEFGSCERPCFVQKVGVGNGSGHASALGRIEPEIADISYTVMQCTRRE